MEGFFVGCVVILEQVGRTYGFASQTRALFVPVMKIQQAAGGDTWRYIRFIKRL
jgi:hypothetical protein